MEVQKLNHFIVNDYVAKHKTTLEELGVIMWMKKM
jgi:hypothetical protein